MDTLKKSDLADRIAAIDDKGDKISYSELADVWKDISSIIPRRKLVFSICSNTIGSMVGYTAFLKNDIVPLLLSSDLDRNLLESLLNTYKPAYIWIPSNRIKEFKGYKVKLNLYSYSLLKTNFEEEYELYEDLALLLTTSGSTGSPKLVRQSYKNILANTKSICQYLSIDENERPITTLPMNYTYGLSIINSHLYVGATILLTDKSIMEKDFWEFFKVEKATSFGGVPYTYEILNKLRFNRMELPSLKTMTQAGGKLSPELHKKYAQYAEERKIAFIVMYGQTEATARMAYLPKEMALEKYGSMGIPIPGGRFSLMDINNNEILKPNVVGELKYYGENVTLGYAECGEDLAKGDDNNGVLVTGDMAKRDDDGYYYIVGRKKRFLKIFGNRVNLDEVERIIKGKFQTLDCACTGVDDKMYIYITDAAYLKEIRTYISQVTGLNMKAFEVKEIKVIPKNDAGKTLYKKLEELYNGI